MPQKMNYNFLLIIVLVPISLFAQTSFNFLETSTILSNYTISKLDSNFIELKYSPDSSLVASPLYCIGYYNKVHDKPKNNYGVVPIAIEQKSTKTNTFYCFKFPISDDIASICFVFIDSLNNIVDNNKGIGYTEILKKNSLTKIGSYGGLAFLLSSPWGAETFYLNPNNQLAKKLFEKEFSLFPQSKRFYWEYYLNTFDKSISAQKSIFEAELDSFAQSDDLMEGELGYLSRQYEILGEEGKAKKFNERILVNYPNGLKATQQKTLNFVQRTYETEDLLSQQEIYAEFTTSIDTTLMDDFTKRGILVKKAQILSEMSFGYFKVNKDEYWQKKVEELNNKEVESFAYFLTALKSIERSRNIKHISKFALKAIDLQKKAINCNIRFENERLFITDREVKKRREYTLSETLNLLGIVLNTQNKLNQALHFLKQASLQYGHRNNDNANENYVETLIKLGKFNEASGEIRVLQSISKATQKIYSLQKSIPNSPELPIKYNSQINLIDEMLTQIPLKDINLESVTLSNYKDKIIIIDIWATWCMPCLEGLRQMESVYYKYLDNSDVVVLFINTQEKNNEASLKSIDILKKHFDKPIQLFDYENQILKITGTKNLPIKLIIDKNQHIRYRQIGIPRNEEELINEVSNVVDLLNQ